MANKRIDQLSELTALESTDLFVSHDVSAVEAKKITKANVITTVSATTVGNPGVDTQLVTELAVRKAMDDHDHDRTCTAGSVAGAVALRFGATSTEGFEITILDETVDLTDAGELFVAMTTAIPDGDVIIAVQANIEVLVVAGGTSTKVGIGINDGDPDEYGLSADLVKNTKINDVPSWAALSGARTLEVCACADAGALGDTDFSAGEVRVRVVYGHLNSLDNAA